MLAIKLLACYKMNNVALKEVKQHKKFKINKNKILLILIIILLILCCIITKEYIKNMIEIDKAYKQYEAQLNAIKYKEQEEEAKRLAEEEKKKKEKMPILTDIGKENIKHIYSNETKRAFLTFDDGPSTITPEILDVLKNENIKATFFVLGANVEKYPETIKRIYEEGHYIANVPEYNSHLFRFPGGLVGGKYAQIKLEAKELLLQNEIVNVDWNALTGDAETNNLSIEFEMSRLQETTNGKNSDCRSTTPDNINFKKPRI